MRKVQNLKPKKPSNCSKQYSQRVKAENDGACMSATAKNGAIDSDMYLKISKRSDANSVHKRAPVTTHIINADATSRFSSCTAKTSPSTDNNSNDNCHVPDFWDKALQANICQENKVM